MLTPKKDQGVAKIMPMLQTLQTVHTAEKGITKDITLMQVQAVKVELQHHKELGKVRRRDLDPVPVEAPAVLHAARADSRRRRLDLVPVEL